MFKRNWAPNVMAVCIGILMALFTQVYNAPLAENQAHQFLLLCYGGIVSWDGLFFLPALAFCLPFFVQLLLFADTMNAEFDIASAYIFPRKDTRVRWLIGNYGKIVLKMFGFYIEQFSAALLVALALGYHFSLVGVVAAILLLCMTLVVINSVLTLMAATLSVRNKTSMIVSLFFSVYFVWIFLLPVTKALPALVQCIPFSHALLFYHALPDSMVTVAASVKLIPLWSTVLYGMLLAVILVVAGGLWIKRTNLLEER